LYQSIIVWVSFGFCSSVVKNRAQCFGNYGLMDRCCVAMVQKILRAGDPERKPPSQPCHSGDELPYCIAACKKFISKAIAEKWCKLCFGSEAVMTFNRQKREGLKLLNL